MIQPHVGLIGIGRMGEPMARRILAAGYPLTVTDIVPANAGRVTSAGATTVPTAAGVAAVADVIVTSVPGPLEIERVFFASDGVFATLRAGCIVVETSTIGVELSRRIGAACDARGAAYIDAPVSGGVEGAAQGTLTVMAGGDAATIDRARAVLASFASRIAHVGPAGAGHLAKLINQIVYLGYAALFCEATSVADAHGLDRAALIDVLRHSVAGSPLSTRWEEALLSGDRTAGFAIARVRKDLHLGADAIAAAGIQAPIFQAALAAYDRAAAEGFDADHLTAIVAPLPAPGQRPPR